MEEQQQQNEQNSTEEKQPRMFTQAEKDRELAMLINKEREKYSDYDTIKSDYEKLMNERKEKEMAEKTEVERLQAQLDEVNSQLVNANGQISDFNKQRVKMTVLDDEKYRKLPRAYKNMVDSSDDMETVQQSAEKALEEFNKDMGGKIGATFGIPKTINTEIATETNKPTVIKDASDIAATLRNKIQSAINLRK